MHVGICFSGYGREGDAGRHSWRGWVVTTVAISNLPASRSYTRTGDGAYARMQSSVTDQNPSMGVSAMPDKLFLGVDIAKDWIDVAIHHGVAPVGLWAGVMRLSTNPQVPIPRLTPNTGDGRP